MSDNIHKFIDQLKSKARAIDPELQKQIDEFHRKSAERIWGTSFTVSAAPCSSPSLSYEKVKHMVDMLKPRCIRLGDKQINVYGYNVEEMPEEWAVLTRILDPDAPIDINAPIGGGVIYINHRDGKLMGREEDIKHFAAHSEIVLPEPSNTATWTCFNHPPGLEVKDIPEGEKCGACGRTNNP